MVDSHLAAMHDRKATRLKNALSDYLVGKADRGDSLMLKLRTKLPQTYSMRLSSRKLEEVRTLVDWEQKRLLDSRKETCGSIWTL